MGGIGGFILQKVSPGRNAPQTTTNMEPENGAPWKKRYFDNFEVLDRKSTRLNSSHT